jgi:hypothetical protein
MRAHNAILVCALYYCPLSERAWPLPAGLDKNTLFLVKTSWKGPGAFRERAVDTAQALELDGCPVC